MGGLFVAFGVGLAIAWAVCVWMVVWRIRRPPRRTYAWAVAKGVPGDPSELDSPREFEPTDLAVGHGNRCPAWIVEGDGPRDVVVIATPGWGDSRVGALVRMDALCAHAGRVIAWDPPGLGECPGLWTMGTREPAMILEIARWARTELGARTVVAYGWSMGGGAAVQASGMDTEGLNSGVIAEAPYRVPWTPAARVVRSAGLPWALNGPVAMAIMGMRLGMGPTWRGRAGFDRAPWAAKARVPIAVVHGSADDICPIEDGRDIARAAGAHGRMIEIEGAGHNDLWTDVRWSGRMAEAVGNLTAEIARGTPEGKRKGEVLG